MKRYLSIILIISLPLFADFAKLGTSGAQFLKIGVGRGAAMGEAFVAISDDATAIYWNPAGLGILTSRQISLQHNEWIADVKHEYLAIAVPLSNMGTLGFGLTALTMGKMEYTTVDDPNTKTVREDTGTGTFFNASDFALGISFGRMFTDRLSAGFTIKAVQEMIWDMSATGIATDFGIHYNTGFKGLKIAASMANFGADITFGGRQLDRSTDPFPDSPLDYQKIPVSLKTTPFALPLIFRFGLAFNPVETEAQRLTVAIDLNHPNDNYETINLGFEYGYLNTIFLRAGYKMYTNIDYMKMMTGANPVYDSTLDKYTYPEWGENTEWLLNNLTAGVGFNLKMGQREMHIDYAYMNKGVLKATHRLGLTLGF
ncbi:MAG: PorV/PorQ family protein [bacterium]